MWTYDGTGRMGTFGGNPASRSWYRGEIITNGNLIGARLSLAEIDRVQQVSTRAEAFALMHAFCNALAAWDLVQRSS